MTHPGEQWVLRRRVFARIRELFEVEGTMFTRREVTVRTPDLDEGRQLSDDEETAVAPAARRAVDQTGESSVGCGSTAPDLARTCCPNALYTAPAAPTDVARHA